MEENLIETERERTRFLLACQKDIIKVLTPSKRMLMEFYAPDYDKVTNLNRVLIRANEIAIKLLRVNIFMETIEYENLKALNDRFEIYLTKIQSEFVKIRYGIDISDGNTVE